MNLLLILGIGLTGCGSNGDNSPTGPDGRDEIVTVATSVGQTLQINKRLLETTKIVFNGDGGTSIMTPDGSNQRMLFDKNFYRLYWSPDGRKIVIEADDSDDIYVMNADGSDYKALDRRDARLSLTSPWSPDGTKILFVAIVADTPYVHLINADGSGRQRLFKGEEPSWSPDGKKIVFNGWGDSTYVAYEEIRHPYISTVNIDGGDARQLAEGSNASWSPDGDHIAFSDRDDVGLYIMYTMDPDGSNKRELISSGQNDDYPYYAWSPDSKKVALVGQNEDYSNSIFIVNSDGSGEPLSITSDDNIYSLSWSPDGSKIVFMAGDDGEDIEMINPDGSNRVTIVRNVEDPIWSPFIPKGVFVESSSGPNQQLNVGVSGTWSGPASDNTGPGRFTFILTQKGTDVNGTFSASDSQSGATIKGDVSGTVSGENFQGQMKGSYSGCRISIDFTASVSGSSMSGTYSGTNSCSGSIRDGRLNLTK